MLPPVDPLVLQQNPRFKAFYEDLCKTKIHSDGSTIDMKQERQREEIRKKLPPLQTAQNKSKVIFQSLQLISSKSTELPPELLEVIQIVSAYLSGQVKPNDYEFIQDDIEFFIENINPISACLSAHITTTLNHLAVLSNPEANASKLPILVPMLPNHLRNLVSTIESQTTSLAAARIELSAIAVQLLETYRHVTDLAIRLLEQKSQGTVARSIRAHAEHLAVVGAGMEMKLKVLTRSNPPDPKLVAALKTYSAHLREVKAGLQGRERQAKTELDRYDKAGGPVMRELANRYDDIGVEIEDVKSEIARLEHGDKR